MTTREEIAAVCRAMPFVYEDYPFDADWQAMRHRENDKVFAFIFGHQGGVWCNVKASPAAAQLWREVYPAVVPAYHMNKTHWVSIVLDGSMADEDIAHLVQDSYELTAKKRTR